MGRYDEICAAHVWRVPERYNIAADCCDKHPRDKLAMIHERFDGAQRELTWGELQDLSNQAANLLELHGVGGGDRVAVVLPPTPETAAILFGAWKLGALLLSMSVLYGDEGIAHRLRDSEPSVLVTDETNAPRFGASGVAVVVLSAELARRAVPRARHGRHGSRRSGSALLHVGHDRARERDRARAPLSPCTRGVRLLP